MWKPSLVAGKAGPLSDNAELRKTIDDLRATIESFKRQVREFEKMVEDSRNDWFGL